MKMGKEPRLSPLSQTVERQGKHVRLDIYESGVGRWVLEAVDDDGNVTAWDKRFESDEAALREAMETIEREGFDSLLGPSAGDGSGY